LADKVMKFMGEVPWSMVEWPC